MPEKPRSIIICVDDEKMLLNILYEQLNEWIGAHYQVEKALGAEEALDILDDCAREGIDVSVVISDYIMPNMKGDELLEKVKLRDPRIKKIMLTGYSSLDGIVSAINRAGLYRYITKPWDNRDLMLTVIEAIKGYESEKKAMDLSKGFEKLYHKYETMYLNLQGVHGQTIKALTTGLDAREPRTAGHSLRVAKYAVAIAKASGLNDESVKFVEYAATLHDVGKIGMKDAEIEQLDGLQLYNKVEYVKRQNEIAEDILKQMADADRLIRGIKYHWEKFDGSGVYGLSGDEIPIEASILGIANYYDIMTNHVAKGQVILPESASQMLAKTSGTIFDPELVNRTIKLILSGALMR